MKKLRRKMILGLFSLLPLAAVGIGKAANAAEETDTVTSIAPADVDTSTLRRYRAAIHAACGKTSDIMGITYHEETQKVDLSSFDSCSSTVGLDNLDQFPPNGEGD